jgi:hypothetical protein
MKNLLVIIAVLVALSACKSTDPLLDKERDLKTIVVNVAELNKEEVDKAQYLSRYLMPADERKLFKNRLLNEAGTWDHTSMTVGFIGASVLTDNPFSTSGGGVAMGISLGLDLIGGIYDGASENISQIWLPETNKNGVKFRDVEDATRYMRSELNVAVLNAFKEQGLNIRCELVCDDSLPQRLYRIDIPKDKLIILRKKYAYLPETIQVFANWLPMVEIKKNNDLESLALGFIPKYKTINGHQIINVIGGGVKKDDTGIAFQFTIAGSDKTLAQWQYDMAEAQFGRDFYRSITTQLPLIMGSDIYRKKFIAYKGEIYNWIGGRHGYGNFIREKVIN